MTRFSAVEISRLLRQPHQPTAEQQAIIEAPLEPVIVVAGAGSGKTETMAARVVYLVANGLVEPDQVLGLTFTRKAAGELRERVTVRLRHLDRVLPGTAAQGVLDLVRPTIATYNSYAAALVGDHVLRIGIEPGARVLGEAAQWQLATLCGRDAEGRHAQLLALLRQAVGTAWQLSDTLATRYFAHATGGRYSVGA